ncbi:MAG: hypothetical protein H6772_02630 [Pseudomonadales bacterium]|nr:hypothetical protein [Pseudomonadales bacterium]
MKMKTALLGVVLVGGVMSISPSLVSAYQGNPNVQGPNYSSVRHEAINQAFSNGDYNSWKQQMEGNGATNRITETNFLRFAEAHKLATQGDLEGAKKIREELGLGLKDGSGQKNGLNRNHDMNQNQNSGQHKQNSIGLKRSFNQDKN